MVDPLGLCGGAAPTASSKLGDVINAIGNFFCNVFGGGGSGGSTAGTGGGGTSGGTTSNTPPPNMRLVPVMSQNEGGILHNVWRLTTFPGAGVVSGDHNVSEHIAVKRNGTVPDRQGGYTSRDSYNNQFNDGLGCPLRDCTGNSQFWQKFTVIVMNGPHKGESFPIMVRIDGHDFNVLTINEHGPNPSTVNDFNGPLPATPDPYPQNGSYDPY